MPRGAGRRGEEKPAGDYPRLRGGSKKGSGTTVAAKTKSDEENLVWARERFVNEGRALAACEHQNVVNVYEMVEANGTAYMTSATCHDVHNTFTVGAAGTGLVKVDPSGSKICLACHNK